MLRFVALLLVLFVSTCFVPSALAEDGAPVTSKPTGCVEITLNGGEDYFASALDQNECVTGDWGQNYVSTFGGRDWFTGKGETDEFHGGNDQDIAYGGVEGDRLFGEGGNDFLYAGCPNGCDQSDNVYADLIEGASGDDTIGACNNFRTVIRGGQGGYDVGYVDVNKDDWSGLEKVIGC